MQLFGSRLALLALVSVVALAASGVVCADDTRTEDGWVSLFDGESLDGWRASEHAGSCKVEDGAIVVGGGGRSHLFYEGPVEDHDFKDFELKLEVKSTPGSNSGIYFHTEYQETDWPAKGYEAQVNNTQEDWRRTGSLYAVDDIRQSPVEDNEWFDYHIIVQGNHVTLKVNGETTVDYTEPVGGAGLADRPGRQLSSGTIALQAHDPGSLVYFRNIRIKTPVTEAAAASKLAQSQSGEAASCCRRSSLLRRHSSIRRCHRSRSSCCWR